MKCRIFFKRENRVSECSFTPGALLSDIILSEGVVPDTVIIYKDDIPVTEDEPAQEADYEIFTTSSRG